ERQREGVGIARLYEKPADISLYDTFVAVDIAGDDRKPGGHRLEEHDPERFLPCRRRAKDVRCLVKARLVRIRDAPGEEDVLEPVVTYEAPQPTEQRTDTAEDETQLGVLRFELGVRLHQIHRALAWLETADEQDVDL